MYIHVHTQLFIYIYIHIHYAINILSWAISSISLVPRIGQSFSALNLPWEGPQYTWPEVTYARICNWIFNSFSIYCIRDIFLKVPWSSIKFHVYICLHSFARRYTRFLCVFVTKSVHESMSPPKVTGPGGCSQRLPHTATWFMFSHGDHVTMVYIWIYKCIYIYIDVERCCTLGKESWMLYDLCVVLLGDDEAIFQVSKMF